MRRRWVVRLDAPFASASLLCWRRSTAERLLREAALAGIPGRIVDRFAPRARPVAMIDRIVETPEGVLVEATLTPHGVRSLT